MHSLYQKAFSIAIFLLVSCVNLIAQCNHVYLMRPSFGLAGDDPIHIYVDEELICTLNRGDRVDLEVCGASNIKTKASLSPDELSFFNVKELDFTSSNVFYLKIGVVPGFDEPTLSVINDERRGRTQYDNDKKFKGAISTYQINNDEHAYIESSVIDENAESDDYTEGNEAIEVPSGPPGVIQSPSPDGEEIKEHTSSDLSQEVNITHNVPNSLKWSKINPTFHHLPRGFYAGYSSDEVLKLTSGITILSNGNMMLSGSSSPAKYFSRDGGKNWFEFDPKLENGKRIILFHIDLTSTRDFFVLVTGSYDGDTRHGKFTVEVEGPTYISYDGFVWKDGSTIGFDVRDYVWGPDSRYYKKTNPKLFREAWENPEYQFTNFAIIFDTEKQEATISKSVYSVPIGKNKYMLAEDHDKASWVYNIFKLCEKNFLYVDRHGIYRGSSLREFDKYDHSYTRDFDINHLGKNSTQEIGYGVVMTVVTNTRHDDREIKKILLGSNSVKWVPVGMEYIVQNEKTGQLFGTYDGDLFVSSYKDICTCEPYK